jgi:hypothetical protein
LIFQNWVLDNSPSNACLHFEEFDMALPPSPAAAPSADMAAVEPAMETAGAGPEVESVWEPVATILKNPDTGEFMVIEGDEPDDGSEPAGSTYPDGPGALRALMQMLEGGAAEADKAFADGYESRAKKPPMMG